MKREGDGTCSLHIEDTTNDDDGNYTIMAANPQVREFFFHTYIVVSIAMSDQITGTSSLIFCLEQQPKPDALGDGGRNYVQGKYRKPVHVFTHLVSKVHNHSHSVALYVKALVRY